jgi:branched-chain amino acid aminotransferase
MMIAFLNGEFIPLSQASLPVWDYGFTMGVTLTEQLRTYRGKVPLLRFSLDRLQRGLETLEITLPESRSQLEDLVSELVRRNQSQVDQDIDWSIGISVTPGLHAARAPVEGRPFKGNQEETGLAIHSPRPTLLLYALPLQYHWAGSYQEGVALQTVSVREIPPTSIPRHLKTRSRIHYYLAEQQASRKAPGSFALLQQLDGSIAEGTTSSLGLVEGNGLVFPPEEDVLASLSVRFLEEVLCPQLKIPVRRAPLSLTQIYEADELLWLSTPSAVLPVKSVDGRAIGRSAESPPSWPLFQRLIKAWSDRVGIDIVEQAIKGKTGNKSNKSN